MKTIYLYSALLFAAFAAAGCSTELTDSSQLGRGAVVFSLSGITADVEVSSQSAVASFAADNAEAQTRPLKSVWYALLDQEDRIITPPHRFISEDLSRMVVEGLYPGKYAAVFLATTEPEAESSIPQVLGAVGDVWLTNTVPGKLFDKEYLYKRVDFTVGEDNLPINIPIALTRLVGLLKVQIDPENPQSTHYIRKIELLFDDASSLYTTFASDNTYSGEEHPEDMDVTTQRNYYSMPTHTPLSGIVRVTSDKIGGASFTRDYPFEDCTITAGEVTTLRVKYVHPEDSKGYFTVPMAAFTPQNSMTMFLDDEPKSVFYNESQRSFYVDEPLKHTIDKDHKLHLQFYSPFPAMNVKVMIRFTGYSQDFYELAHYEQIPPFHESWMELPVVTRDCLFKSADGREVLVPAKPELSNANCELKIVTDDPFINKMTAIDSHWLICFGAYSADSQPSSWQHMTPYLCRHACAMMQNSAYMFSTAEFSTELDKYDGILKDDDQIPINLATLRRVIRGHKKFILGRVSGVGGLGGGYTYGLMQECFLFSYHDATGPKDNPHSYDRMAIYHELGHCFGYGHDSNMTFGDQWTVLCANVLVAQGRRGELPVCSKNAVGSLPRK